MFLAGASSGADFNGDGTGDVAVFRPVSGLWVVRGITRAYFGSSGDVPVPADYDGGVRDVPAIFRPVSGLWTARGVTRIYFGQSGDSPVPGDPDGDRREKPGIFRPGSGLWVFRGVTRAYFGASADRALAPGKGARRGGLPVTGQTTSYAGGDDGDLQAGSAFSFQTFISSGDLLTRDRNTGLIWAADGNAEGCFNGQTATWSQAVNHCDSLNFGGYEDWRLPNVRELQSIVDYGRMYPAVDGGYFPNTSANYEYWTSTTWTTWSNIACTISFTTGCFSSQNKVTLGINRVYLRAVRGP